MFASALRVVAPSPPKRDRGNLRAARPLQRIPSGWNSGTLSQIPGPNGRLTPEEWSESWVGVHLFFLVVKQRYTTDLSNRSLASHA